MNVYEMFRTDSKAEAEAGIDLDYGAFRIRIVRAGGSNRKFGELLAKRLKPHRRQLENEMLDNAVAEKIMAETYADAIILGWNGVTDENGKPLEFNRENVIRLLLDLPELFRDIQAQATSAANFRLEERAPDAKNFKSSSAGK